MALEVQVEKTYGDFHLKAEFQAEGEPLALLGPSGCGKSLTLKCIAGIERPDRGRIVLDGQVLFDSERRIDLPPQKRQVGYLFQQYALFPHMTVAENIATGCHRLGRDGRRKRTAELMALLRLEGLGDLRPRQLSGGQQQRTALARILASEPRTILLDEPFSALDSHLKWQLEPELKDVLDAFGGVTLWVTHDRGEAYPNCPRVCVMEAGRTSPVRGMAELMADPRTVGAARLSGCRNCVKAGKGETAGSVRLPEWGVTLHCVAPWREGVTALGIREEQVRPAKPGEENAVECVLARMVEDVSSATALLRPVGALPGAPLLRMAVKNGTALAPGEHVTAALPAEDLMILE